MFSESTAENHGGQGDPGDRAGNRARCETGGTQADEELIRFSLGCPKKTFPLGSLACQMVATRWSGR